MLLKEFSCERRGKKLKWLRIPQIRRRKDEVDKYRA
jgi:hypothetical protein